jgi:hypothetical protein
MTNHAKRIGAPFVLVAMLLGAAHGQATWIVESLIPDVVSLRVPTTSIAFELDRSQYPPDRFPARYAATRPEGGTLPVQVFSNAEGLWNLILEIPDLQSDVGVEFIPSRQILYRVNDGAWLRADGNPQIVYSQRGPTADWEEIRIDFALELTGSERAGAYVLNAVVTASRQPRD